MNVIIPDGGNPERKIPGPNLNHVGPGGAAHLPDAERRPLGGAGPRAVLASVLHLQQVFVQNPHSELLDGVPDQPDGAGHGHAAAGVLRVARSGRVRVQRLSAGLSVLPDAADLLPVRLRGERVLLAVAVVAAVADLDHAPLVDAQE